MVTTSPCLIRRLWRTTRFRRQLPSSRSSSPRTTRTVSFLFLPRTRTVSPRNSWSASMVLLERAIIELSSLMASVTLLKADVSWSSELQQRGGGGASFVHELIGLLLLLQDGRRSVIFVLALGTRSVPMRCQWLQVGHSLTARASGGVLGTHIRWLFFFSEWSGVGSGAIVTSYSVER